jgi:tetratricopeptide (TPR) repeat protein
MKRTGDHGAVQPDARERLLKADELLKAGQPDAALVELQAVAASYSQRGAPLKAVAVLRQAVRVKPDNPDVHLQYGEVLTVLRMKEDAAREFASACQLLEASGRYGDWLNGLRRLIALDEDNLHGRLQLAEALARAGRAEESAKTFKALADWLLRRDEIADWELVAERALVQDPDDTTLAHDLALHYVRSGKHAMALSKLAICYEAGAVSAELLELSIDTLEALGQLEKAALVCRELLRMCRRTGLHDEADKALQRLYSLDPSDPEAAEAVGAMQGGVAEGTVLALEAGASGQTGRHRQMRATQTAHPRFDSQVMAALKASDIEAAKAAQATALPQVTPRRLVEPSVATPSAVQTAAPTAVPTVVARPPAQVPAASQPAPVAMQAAQVQVQAAPAAVLLALDDDPGFGEVDHTVLSDPLLSSPLRGSELSSDSPSSQEPVASTRRRSASLPRPRLTRRMGTATDLPTTLREMSKDISTLEFFISGGYVEAAAALLDALEKRHPDRPELMVFRARVDKMRQGG